MPLLSNMLLILRSNSALCGQWPDIVNQLCSSVGGNVRMFNSDTVRTAKSGQMWAMTCYEKHQSATEIPDQAAQWWFQSSELTAVALKPSCSCLLLTWELDSPGADVAGCSASFSARNQWFTMFFFYTETVWQRFILSALQLMPTYVEAPFRLGLLLFCWWQIISRCIHRCCYKCI